MPLPYLPHAVVPTGDLIPHRLSGIDVGGLYRTRDGLPALLEVDAFLAAGLCALPRRPWPLAAVAVAETPCAPGGTEPAARLRTDPRPPRVRVPVGGVWRMCCGRCGTCPREAGAALLGRYARVAAALLAAITATGVRSSLRRMPPDRLPDRLTSTAYCRALLAEVLLVAVVAVLALSARRRLRRAPGPLGAATPARAEVAAPGLVVAVSGPLTALPLPIRRS